MTKSRETGEVLNTRGTAATKDTGLLTGQVPTSDDLSMVGETTNYTGANYQPTIADGLNVAKEMRNLSGGTVSTGANIAGTDLRFGEIDATGAWTDVGSSDGTYINITKAAIGANKRGTFTKVSN